MSIFPPVFEEKSSPVTGRILHLQRLSTEDGPGLRTTVFFKGCPLNCQWCHNPESISPNLEIQWLENHCIGCNTCLGVCPLHCLSRSEAGLHIDRERCNYCGLCVDECPANALELLGKHVEIADLVRELAKDRVFYYQSGGGVTLSGGEPTQQATFTIGLLEALKREGIHTAVDSCGLCSRHTLLNILKNVDLFLFDVKLIDERQHIDHTGQSNRQILENLAFLGEHLGGHAEPKLWVRTPIIPGVTDKAENITGIGNWLADVLPGVLQRWELCAFNNLCRDKYRRLEKKWIYNDLPLVTKKQLAQVEDYARHTRLNPDIVYVSGPTQLEI